MSAMPDLPECPPTGDLDPEAFRRAGYAVTDWIVGYLAHPERWSVQPDVEPGALLEKLPPEAPAHPSSQEDILADFERTILPHAVHWNHPGFMGYFAAGGSFPGILAETLIAALNNIGLLWSSSPALTELEERTLQWLGQLLGLPASWFGMIHGTASAASLHAMIAARERAVAIAEQAGSSVDLNRLVIYASAHAHSSIEKTTAALGVGREACRKIEVDERYAMKPAALREAIASDRRNGFVPIAVAATIGTTGCTAVDPVPALAEIADEHALWLHIDAAYAGAAAMLPEMRRHFAGCERADSFVVNPHKWMFVPMDLTAFYTAHPEYLRKALSLVPEYLRSREYDRTVNYMEYAIPLGRRFRALKLWYVLRSLGAERVAAALREHIRLARWLADQVDASPDFERMAPTHFSLVCLRFRAEGACTEETDAANERLLRAVNATGEFFLSHTRLRGQYVIRVAIGNLRTTEAHVRRLWERLQELAPSHPKPAGRQ